MSRLYTNENFPRKVVELLRSMGHDVLTAAEAGQANRRITDREVLDFAAGADRAVLTLNRRDFIGLHRLQPDHAGIIVCTQDADVDGQAQRIHEAIEVPEGLSGKLIRVNRPLQ